MMRLALLSLASVCLLSPFTSLGQGTGTSPDAINAPVRTPRTPAQVTPERDKKRNRKASKRPLPNPVPESPSTVSGASEEALNSPPSPYFPDWGRPLFDWSLGPLFGLRYEAQKDESGTVQTTTTEIGLRGSLSHIAIVPGQPGLGLGLHGGQAWGTSAAANFDAESRETSSINFTRTFAGLSLTAYYAWLKQTLSYTQARLAYSDDAKTLLQSGTLGHDLGVLILPWLSTHHTYTYLRAYGDRYSQPLLVQHDHWLHARLFTDFLSMYFDFGPGWTLAREYQENIEGTSSEIAKGRTDDFRALTGMHLFWKLGASGEAKYVYRSSSEQLGSLAGIRLPAEELSELSSVALPEDSLRASLFLGLRDLFYGLSVGWRYQMEVLNMSEKGGREKRERSSQGPVLGYIASF